MASCSSKNGSCVSTASSSFVPASIATTTLVPVATINSSQYANESCLAEPHAKLGPVRDKKQQEEVGGQTEEASLDGEVRATSGTSSTSHKDKRKQQQQGEKAKQQMQVDYNEAQENVRMSVLVDPERSLADDDSPGSRNSSSLHHQQQLGVDYSGDCCGASDNEANQQRRQQQQQQQQVQKASLDEDEGEEDEEMERRLFGLSLTDEMKKQIRKQRFKLFSRAHLKKRKRKRQPASSNHQLGAAITVPTSSTSGDSRVRPSERLKSALTRQGTTTANYADLAPDTWLQEMQSSFQGMSKQPPMHAPLLQKLFSLDKLSPSSSNSHLVGHQMLADHQMAGHPRLFMSSALDSPNNGDLLNNWAASDPTGARSALIKHAQSKMIPIEIIGLDPQVTKSILQTDSAADESLASSFASDSSMDNPTLAAVYPPGRLRPSKTSILHVHHFHTTRPLLGQTTLPAAAATLPLESGLKQQHTGSQLNLRQAFLNERGEIVYFDAAANLPGTAAGLSKIEQPFMPDSLEPLPDLNTVSAPDVASSKLSHQPSANQGGAMVQYVPASSQLSQHSTLLLNNKQEQPGRQRFLATNNNGQTVSVMDQSSGPQPSQQVNPDELQQQQQFPGQQQQSTHDKMLMVAYRPQLQSSSASNHSIEESMVNKYNEGQESKASMVSAGGLVLRPLSNMLQSVIPHRNPADFFGSSEMGHLPFVTSNVLNKGGKLHLPLNFNSATVPSAAMRQHNHYHEPDLMIKGPPPVDSQSFWLGAPSEQQLSPFSGSPLPVTGFKNNSHLFPVQHSTETNQRRLQQVPAIGGQRSQINATLTPPSQDFLRKLLKGIQLHKDTSQNLSFASPHLLPTIKSVDSIQPSKHLIRDMNQPAASQQQSSGKPTDLSQQSLRLRNQASIGNLNEAALRDFGGTTDVDGLGNITLAFISVVSLLTLILIAASMLYRHRRRSSVSRCASLPVRSRLNLTHRTKRFMRSNFVRPDQGITPIKRVDLDSNCSSPAAKLGSPRPSSGQQQDGQLTSPDSQRVPSVAIKATSGDRYSHRKPTGVPAQLLSTFNGAQPACHATTTSPTADIKTLNTRLQKSSYLKSLIYRPSCMSQLGCSFGHKQHQAPSNGRKLANPVDTVCYLSSSNNNNTPRQQSDGNMVDAEGGKSYSIVAQRSHSFKNQSSTCDHNYSFARKSSSADRNSIDSKHFNINRLPTINSDSENNLHSSSKFSDSDSSNQQQQLKQRGQVSSNNITCRANELKNQRHHITDKFLVERRL